MYKRQNISSVMLNKKFFFSRKKFNPFDNALGSLGKLDKGRESTSDVCKKMPVFFCFIWTHIKLIVDPC